MNSTKFYFLILFFSQFVFSQDFTKHVNPFIGTDGHGHTFPGATLPYGMIQLSPDTRVDGSWDGCSGYHYSDKIIYGFSHTHLNGTGCSDYGDVMLMPSMGKILLEKEQYASSFSHDNEKASAGFYSVKLDRNNIDVRLTSSTRVGFHEYTFNNAGEADIVIDLNHRDKLLYGEVKVIDDKTIEIFRRSEAWAKDQYIYARIEFNVSVKVLGYGNERNEAKYFSGTKVAIKASKNVKKGEKILVKVALSPTGYDGAKLNMSEIKHWDFEKVKKDAEATWNKELSKIQVASSDKDKLAVFYTALYHTMMQPNIAEDIDGKYRGRDNKIHVADTFDYYSVFSLWDTFRAAHPLYTLIDKKRTSDYVNTFIKQYEQGGRLPVWELASNETDCMIGYHSVSVIADAMVKGIKGFDYEKAFEASKHSAMLDHLGLEAYKKNGFISMDDEHESVSKTVEYAYDDWCIAQMAKILNKKEDYEYFMKRSQSWKNIFDWETGFMRPKKNGGWDKPFDPREVNNNFTEGNSWQYSFFVLQDIPGMIEAYGGPQKFEAKLDEMFNGESKTTGREQVDVTGLIGQYAHGNEPSHHMAYLYNYVGKPEKTKEKVHYILNEFYKNTPDGLIGNEDCGQMSAWYVLSSIGIYSVTPGETTINLVKPIFKNVMIKNQFDKFFELNDISEKGLFADFIMLGSKYIEASSYKQNMYYTLHTLPVIDSDGKSFKDKLNIKITTACNYDKIYYSFRKKGTYKEYKEPIVITKSTKIYTYTDYKYSNMCGPNFWYVPSDTISAEFFKKPNNYTINIKSKYNPQYHAGGAEGLLDGIFGSENWRKGDWQGYQSQDFECVIDRQTSSPVNIISANFLQDQRSWILMPTQVEFYVSNDNVNFELVDKINNDVDPKIDKNILKSFDSNKKVTSARYVKVIAKNFGKLPEWHQGAGGDAFIFIDEITIK
ncbi:MULTISPECIES: GH92 family glycosyl hydrolase [Flavobacterium]|uniref:Alpha-mannosidase n=1 Tax=Flavobacterium hankyongi TaxID=1176532 RepID=A0ABP8ZMN1_9FLAO|nr:GH92 family glycosyl hydrolase [Flavobacterium sp. N1846]